MAYRISVLSRTLAAVLGGYVSATLLGIVLSEALPGPRADTVTVAMMSSFAVHAATALWMFSVRTAGRAWICLLITWTLGAALWSALPR